MNTEHDRAFKEWAVACEALRQGRQILLIRKGGIREEGGVFRVADSEFFLLPTYEHQNAGLLQPEFAARLQALQSEPRDPNTITIDSYAVVDTVAQARGEAQLSAVANDHIWNAEYVRQRFDFNPYDPLYLILLRVYTLPTPAIVPMQPAYVGCKSWVTLDRPLSTQGATPALSDAEFSARRAALLERLNTRAPSVER
jgi:hypothetical protein